MQHPRNTRHPSALALAAVYLALLALLALTALVSRLPPGWWSLPAGLGIAVTKLLLIFYFFMELCRNRGLVWLFAGAGFFWLAIAAALTFSDYLTRGWMR